MTIRVLRIALLLAASVATASQAQPAVSDSRAQAAVADSRAQPAVSDSRAQPAVPEEIARALPEIDRQFADWMLDARVPGLVYGIVADGRLVHVRGLGVQDLDSRRPVTADSLFRIASMSKAFTALALLDLRDKGAVRLDAPAATYVPEMQGWALASPDSEPITVQDLLHHVAGFVTDDPWGDRQTPMPEAEFTKLLAAGVPFTRATATAYEYSNLGYATLGRIITNVSGRNFADTIEATVLKPLGMTSSGYDVFATPQAKRALGYRWENGRWLREPEMGPGAFGAMGGLQTSANDYARYVAWLLSAWPAGSAGSTKTPAGSAGKLTEPAGSERTTFSGPLKRSTVRELARGNGFAQSRTRPGKTGATACRVAATYGGGMISGQDCDLGFVLFHGGGYPGYGSHILLLPDAGVGIFAFANRTYAPATAAVWDAALVLQRAGALKPAAIPTSAALAEAYKAAGRIYAAGSLQPEMRFVAMNMTMDRSAEGWAADLARMKGETGACATDSPVRPTGALSGTFSWRCATGRISGQILLAPTTTPQIQALRLSVVAP